MMRRLCLIFLLFTLIPFISNGQRWKRQRVEYSLGIGATGVLSDLGGADRIGTNGLRDLEINATRYSIFGGYRYRLTQLMYVKGNLGYLRISGDDALTQERARNQRQLSFKTNIVELSGQFEVTIIKSKGSGALYRLKGVSGKKWLSMDVYAFLGLGTIWYNPRGERDGQMFSLRKLNTEGQGLPGGAKPYSGVTTVIPFGLGFKKGIGPQRSRFSAWSVGLEVGVRKTFTDYLDDVSTFYYGSKFIREAYGDDAAYFADPSGIINDDHTTYGEPQQRGDPKDKDTYLTLNFSVNYKITKKRRNLPKF